MDLGHAVAHLIHQPTVIEVESLPQFIQAPHELAGLELGVLELGAAARVLARLDEGLICEIDRLSDFIEFGLRFGGIPRSSKLKVCRNPSRRRMSSRVLSSACLNLELRRLDGL